MGRVLTSAYAITSGALSYAMTIDAILLLAEIVTPAVAFLVVTDRRSPVRYVDRDVAFRDADRHIAAGLVCEVDEMRDDGVVVWRWDPINREWAARDA